MQITRSFHNFFPHHWVIHNISLCMSWKELYQLYHVFSVVLLWTPTYGWAKAGWPAWTYIQQLCEDTGRSPEDLPEAMNDREKWRERVRDILAAQHDDDGDDECYYYNVLDALAFSFFSGWISETRHHYYYTLILLNQLWEFCCLYLNMSKNTFTAYQLPWIYFVSSYSLFYILI